MKSNIKKISILSIILLIILGSFIFYINTEKISNLHNIDITKKEALIQDFLTHRNMNEKTITEDKIQYDFIENGNIIIMEYFGYEDCIIIPKELANQKIEKIDSKAFINNENLEIIKIPNEIAKNVEQIDKFEISHNLSNDEYTIYITIKEYTQEYLDYIKLTDEEKIKTPVIPRKFVETLEDIYANEPSTLFNANDVSIPSSYDLRNKINIQVENQEQLGICYSYATIKSIETNLLLTKSLRKNFSEIDLAVKSRQFCGGNFTASYSNYLRDGNGPVTEVSNTLLNQPYLTSQRYSNTIAGNIYNACYSDTSTMNDTQTTTAINALNSISAERNHYVMSYQNFAYITGDKKTNSSYANEVTNNRNLIKENIMKYGSIYTYIESPTAGKNYYDGGSTAVQYQANRDSNDVGYHAVSIIGWNDNFDKSNFPSYMGVSNNGAWLVLNSWGSTWGNGDGTWWISYDDYWVESDNYAVKDVSQGKVDINNANITLSTTPYTYDGNNKQPFVYLTYNNDTRYYKGTDYSVEYINNINAGTATAKITGLGRFTGTVNKTFSIQPKTISSVTLATNSYTYDGTAKTPAVTVTDGSKTLTLNTDYTLTYNNNINVGSGTVTIIGKGNYSGSINKTFKISAKSISSATATLETNTYTYDGTAKTPTVTVKDGSKTLTLNTDYTLTYNNNINVGSGTVVITGKGNYNENINKTFTISAKSINSTTITLDSNTYTYDGTAKTPTVTVKDGNKSLTLNTDYTIEYSNNINAGTAGITITGKNNYKESKTVNFTINKANIEIDISNTNITYNGSPHGITINVISPISNAIVKYGITEGEYTLSSSPTFTEPGTYNIYYQVTTANYNTLEGTQPLTITPIDINTSTFTLSTNNFIYDNTEKLPEFTLKNTDFTLTKGIDYTVQYSNNINVGTASITITGIGHYGGTLEKTFTISPQDLSLGQSILPERVTYNGKAQTPQVEVKNKEGITLVPEKDYTINYSNNTNAGTATVTILGKNNYTGTITKNFTIDNDNLQIEANDYETTFDGKEHGIEINIMTELDNAIIKYGLSEEECNLEISPVYINAGTYTIYYEINANNYNTVKGSLNIKINTKNINLTTSTLINTEEYIYNGVEKKPIVTVKDENTTLDINKDYLVTYDNNTSAGTGIITIAGIGNYTGSTNIPFTIKKGTPNYTLPSGLVVAYGTTLENVSLPKGFSWENDLNTEVGEIGLNTFKCTYTPEDTENYTNVTGLDVTLKVTEKLSVNIEKFITQTTDDETEIYISNINPDTPLDEIKNNIKTNGTLTIYESDGIEVTDNTKTIKTGMKLKIKTEAESIDYTISVLGDNNGDGKFNAIDLLKLARYLADIDKNLTGEYLHACNVYKDNKINNADLLKMARIISELESFN